MALNLREAVVKITGSDSGHFGTGFVIHKEENASYVLTCSHVVDVVGKDKLQAADCPALVVASDTEDGFDLAVLRVEAGLDFPVLQLQAAGGENQTVTTAGYYEYGKQCLIQDLNATLGKEITVDSQNLRTHSSGWHLKITEDNATLQPGYSGAPILNTRNGCVLGIVNQRKGTGERGLVVSIAALAKIWGDMPAQLLQKHEAATIACPPQEEPRMNRDTELAAFERIATGEDTETRLILVHGASGMGKSYLLDLYREIANHHHLYILDIPLGPQIRVVDCLDRIVSHYGWQHFPSYDKAETEGIPDPLTRLKEEQWWRTLTRKFFMDLENYREASPLAVFFDPYEKADYAFRNWMSSIFLPIIPVHCSIILIIAGQEVVTPAPASRTCRHFPLNGVTADWYHRYVEACNAPLDPHEVDLFYEALKGEPKRFVDIVTARLSAGGAR